MNASIVGRALALPLTQVAPNPWNPNVLTSAQYESLKYGLKTDGWIASQAILVWGTDDHGGLQNLIIDGEHRHRAATELGFKKAPMVVLDGLSEPEAKALTIQLDAKRGQFNHEKLSAIVSDMVTRFETSDLALELGFTDEEVAKLLSVPEIVIDDNSPSPPLPPAGGGKVTSENPNVKVVPLYLSNEAHAQFGVDVAALMKRYGSETITAAVLRATKEAFEANI